MLGGSSAWSGLAVSSTTALSVQGNRIGLGADGLTPCPNFSHGIEVRSGNSGLQILDNVIAANGRRGVDLQLPNISILIKGNTIGLSADATLRGNGWEGVACWSGDATGVVVGGSEAGDGNAISGNLLDGILVAGANGMQIVGNTVTDNDGAGVVVRDHAQGVTISRNVIHNNSGIAIDLDQDGITYNDSGDTDDGSNQLLNFPQLWRGTGAAAALVRVAGMAGPDQTIEIFSAEAASGHGGTLNFLRAIVADGVGYFETDLPALDGWVTATATDSSGNTSELARNVPLVNVPPVLASVADKTAHLGRLLSFVIHANDANQPPQELTFSLLGNGPPGLTVDAVNGLCEWLPGHDVAPGTYGVTVEVSDSGTPALSAAVSFTITLLPALSLPPEGIYLVPTACLSHDGAAGLLGSYVNESLYAVTDQADWRGSQTIAGTRTDDEINFAEDRWGARQPVGITGGASDENWDNFSVQWDGVLSVRTPGTRVYLRCEDSARLWIDANGDGVFASEPPEFLDDAWGARDFHYAVNEHWFPASEPLGPGDYRIRIQYQEGYGANAMYLCWTDAVNTSGIVAASGAISAGTEVGPITLPLTAGRQLVIRPRSEMRTGVAYAPGVAIRDPDGVLLSRSENGRVVQLVVVRSGDYTVTVDNDNATGVFEGLYRISFTDLALVTSDEAAADGATLTPPAAFSGRLSGPTDIDDFTFQAVAGQTAVVTWPGLPGDNPAVALLAPDGNVVHRDTSGLGLSADLGMSGTYTLQVSGVNDAGPADGMYAGELLLSTAATQAQAANGFDGAAALQPVVLSLVPSTCLQQTVGGPAGLIGSYVNTSLRNYDDQDDWRQSQSLSGQRADSVLGFTTATWGSRAEVQIAGGTDLNWESFSVQWDGFLVVKRDGTRVFLRSDDGSRMWIDVNDDGSFDASGPEFLDGGWGNGQPVVTSAASEPLATGSYRIRVQYEEGVGANDLMLLWDDPGHSGGPAPNRPAIATGVLTDVDDRDTFAVDLVAGQLYNFSFLAAAGDLGKHERVLELYNGLGQLLGRSFDGWLDAQLAVGPQPLVGTGRHFLVVQATSPLGLGAYGLSAAMVGSFPETRQVPLLFFDTTAQTEHLSEGFAEPFTRPELVPELRALAESRVDIYDVDLTANWPGEGEEYVGVGIGEFENDIGGLGAGWRGNTRPSGDTANKVVGEANYDSFADSSVVSHWLINHELGHGLGLGHARQLRNIMSYYSLVSQSPPGPYFSFTNADQFAPYTVITQERNYLDWIMQAGRYLWEQEPNDSQETAQDTALSFAQMGADATARNDRVIVVGSLTGPADVDCFLLAGAAGEQIAIDIDAAEFHGGLDATVVVTDAGGNLIAESTDALDRNSGLDSLDPYLIVQLPQDGTYVVTVTAERKTYGDYRLKLTPARAWDTDGPRIIAAIPDNGSGIDATRQLIFWFNDLLDPLTLTDANVEVRGDSRGIQNGQVVFDVLDATLVWTATAALAVDNYTVTLRSGAGGITDLLGNQLDGESGRAWGWPKVSGNGIPGGDFSMRFTVFSGDQTPAQITWTHLERTPNNSLYLQLHFNDEIDVSGPQTTDLTLRQLGPDFLFDTADDILVPIQTTVNRVTTVVDPHLMIVTRGIPDPGAYRLDGQLLDAAGHTVTLAEHFDFMTVVPGSYLRTATGLPGLDGSYVDKSLRDHAVGDDWRLTQLLAGSRLDAEVNFRSGNDQDISRPATWGRRDAVGITGGPTDADWDDFSVQWDGFITIPSDGVRLATRSDDGSRFWLDLDDDGRFDQFVDNDWGSAFPAKTGPASVRLSAGTYGIRIQYEEGIGRNDMQLVWDALVPEQASGDYAYGPSVIDTSFDPNAVSEFRPLSLQISFSGNVDPTTLNSETVRLRLSADPVMFDDDDVYLDDADGLIEWDPSLHLATFQLASPLADGYYLLELEGDDGGIRDLRGSLLDGEYLDPFIPGNSSPELWPDTPSGDGIPGGDYRAAFAIRWQNHAPQAVADFYALSEDEELVIAATGVLDNDHDVDWDELSAALVEDVVAGTLTLFPRGAFIYVPDADAYGADSFSYTVTDANGATSEPAVVSLSIAAVNDPPVAMDDDVTTEEDAPVTISVLANDTDIDGDVLAAVCSTPASHGVLITNGDGTCTYTPDANFAGGDTFTYSAADGKGGSDTGTVTVTVAAADDAPTVGDMPAQTVDEGAAFAAFDLDDFLSEVDGDAIVWQASGNSELRVAIDLAHVVSVTPPHADWFGSETIVFTATDQTAAALSSSNTVVFTANPVDDPPLAALTLPTVAVDEDAHDVELDLTGLFTDVDNDDGGIVIAVAANSAPDLVTATVDGRRLTLAFAADGNGVATIDLQGDSQGLVVTTELAVIVAAVNDAPVGAGLVPLEILAGGGMETTVALPAYFADLDQPGSGAGLHYAVVDIAPATPGAALIGDETTLRLLPALYPAGGQITDVTVQAVDDPGASDVTIFRVKPGYALTLDPGWTLIGSPVDAEATIGELLASAAGSPALVSIWGWEHARLRAMLAGERLSANHGYWVYTPTRLEITKLLVGAAGPAPIMLQPGWNLVGAGSPAPAPGASVIGAWLWQGASYRAVNPDDPPALLRGYWLYSPSGGAVRFGVP